MSRVLPDQLARGSGRGGLETGHDLTAEGKGCHRLNLAGSRTHSRSRNDGLERGTACVGTLLLQEGQRVSRAGELLLGAHLASLDRSVNAAFKKARAFHSSTRLDIRFLTRLLEVSEPRGEIRSYGLSRISTGDEQLY